VTTTRIDLSTEYFGGMNAPTVEQAGFAPRVDATGLNLEYLPLTQVLLATGTWDGESLSVQVKGSGARTITLPDPDNAEPGFEVLIVDALGNSGAGNITIDPSGGGTIATAGGSAASTLVLSTNYASARLHWVSAGVWVRV
jgi:hypothetical protein